MNVNEVSDGTNQLAKSASPYLRQHADNPVHWYMWSDEVFERAKKLDRPIFLSIGYSACHWCHVMAHESFEDQHVADYLNEHFVCIKVDREERPDIDALYMEVTQMMTGRGGWPNSVWLTPDGSPWFAGTYFPREDRGGAMGFKSLLRSLQQAWVDRRKDVEGQANKIAGVLKQRRNLGGESFDRAAIEQALFALGHRFDSENGGFGGAPKFPPHSNIALLLNWYEQKGEASALEMSVETLEAMAMGGLRDHIGGGFHRYSTDAHWLLPHFEKMLYDNALLLSQYAQAYRMTGNERYREVVAELVAWLKRDMLDPGGAFYAALDADTEGEEGTTYTWPYDEVKAVLGDEFAAFIEAYQIKEAGNFRDEATGRMEERNIPHLQTATLSFTEQKAKLLEVREKRAQPGPDNKILTSWNGLLMAGLVDAATSFDEPAYLELAIKQAAFFKAKRWRNGRLLHSGCEPATAVSGFLDDYAMLAQGLTALYRASGDEATLTWARHLVAVLDKHFADPVNGPYFFTADDAEKLLRRELRGHDAALPSGNGVMVQVLASLYELTGDVAYLKRAKSILHAFAEELSSHPSAFSSMLAGAVRLDEPAVPASIESVVVEKGVVSFKLRLAKGWHLTADHLPTLFVEGLELGEITFPDPVKRSLGGEEVDVLEGIVPVTIQVKSGLPDRDLRLVLTLQLCDDSTCYSPRTLSRAFYAEEF